MRVLVACECSGIVRDAFIARGHDAWSCDLKPSERTGPHIQDDVLLHLEDGWDLLIAHPPCTYLCSSGLHWNTRREGRYKLTHDAMLFVLNLFGEGFVDNPIPMIGLENPIGCISSNFRPPDQIIQPWQFGDDASKATCLWRKNLPALRPTSFAQPRITADFIPRWSNQTDSGQNKLCGTRPETAADRARTYPGIAAAMADQWGSPFSINSQLSFMEEIH